MFSALSDIAKAAAKKGETVYVNNYLAAFQSKCNYPTNSQQCSADFMSEVVTDWRKCVRYPKSHKPDDNKQRLKLGLNFNLAGNNNITKVTEYKVINL